MLVESTHTIVRGDARRLDSVADASIHLVVTSPPYPMISMWDDTFTRLDPRIPSALSSGDGRQAFLHMHENLDQVWRESYRVLVPGGFLCINIGDAARRLGSDFRLYTNHARVIHGCEKIGFVSLPIIHWRKPTNAPTKFMGSGMLPAGAYVTLEHEYVLVFRRGAKRTFNDSERLRRRRSAFFWEERNRWFSDAWEILGVRQNATGGRARSAAFPLELAFRLVNMYSLVEDTVLDPFLGTGTTTRAAIAAGRSSIGWEIDENLIPGIQDAIGTDQRELADRQLQRLRDHREFVAATGARGKRYSAPVGPVVTSQEVELEIPIVERVEQLEDLRFMAYYQFTEDKE